MSEQGVTLWFTGLSGAGKSTIARRVEEILRERGEPVEWLDGDAVREHLARDLGFTREDRQRNVERITYVAKLLTKHGVIVLVSAISPYRESREYARNQIGRFVEIFVDAPLDVVIARDVKGLYKRALAGEIDHFTGVSDPYEPPKNPEITLDTVRESVEQCARRVIDYLEAHRWITPAPLAEGRVSR